jgi:hypothetical protein
MGALSRLTDRIDGWRRQRAAFRELEEIGPDGRVALSRDVGVSADALSRLVARGLESGAGLPRLMRALGLDPERVAKVGRAVARDMEVVCSECRSSSRCARDLDAVRAHLEYEAYCPNAETLSALLQEHRGAAPKAAAAPAIENASPIKAPWGSSKALHRAAQRWPMTKRVERQAHLMGAMMERGGVDLGAAAREGRGAAFAAASRRCLACPNSDACERWLVEAGENTPPAFCPNATFFSRARALGAALPGSGAAAFRLEPLA